MQFSSQTEYSVRILLFLACQQVQGRGAVSISTLSEALGINRNYLPKILKPLKDHHMLRSEAGSQGGFSLAIDPETTTMLDIFAVTEGNIKLNPCLDSRFPCNLNREDQCPVRKIYQEFQTAFEAHFGEKTLADLVQQELARQKDQNL